MVAGAYDYFHLLLLYLHQEGNMMVTITMQLISSKRFNRSSGVLSSFPFLLPLSALIFRLPRFVHEKVILFHLLFDTLVFFKKDNLLYFT